MRLEKTLALAASVVAAMAVRAEAAAAAGQASGLFHPADTATHPVQIFLAQFAMR